MTFSKEEKQIWERSEVMRELERIAQTQSLETPEEAFLPIKTAEDWEDELTDEEKLVDALKEFEKEDENIDRQREKEVEFDEEKIMPVPKHEEEISNPEFLNLDPADEEMYVENLEREEEKEKLREYGEGEVRPWDWRGTLSPTQIEAQKKQKKVKKANDEDFDDEEEIEIDYTEEEYMRMDRDEEKYFAEMDKRVEEADRQRRKRWQTEGPSLDQLEMMAEMDPEERAEFVAMMERKVESSLMGGLTKLASHLAKQGKVVEAHKIESAVRDIRMTLEANNG